jgi:actin-related protein 5
VDIYAFAAKAKGKKADEPWLVGKDIFYDTISKVQTKSPYDQSIMCYFDMTEVLLDYTFVYLGLEKEGRIDHPIVMTEPLCNLNYSRGLMSELLFEVYQIPSVCYGVDALFSYYANQGSLMKPGLIFSCGHYSLHIIPIWDGRAYIDRTKRIGFGGATLVDYTEKLLNIKYPYLLEKMSGLHMRVSDEVKNRSQYKTMMIFTACLRS